jgi:SAM-dependent methyltransferase
VSRESNDGRRTALHEHLAWWGLRRFASDADYFAWQSKQLSPAELNQLKAQVERKRGGDRRDEIAFYNLTAQPQILPVLYCQRYEYYSEIGFRVASCIEDAHSILDFGCGVGILTTFYGRQFPDKEFIGIDRSPVSVARAQEKAKALGLSNVRFACADIERDSVSGSYDLMVATHALLQAERDPGMPSQSWRTFDRAYDPRQQAAFEQRTGIGLRLDRLSALLVEHGCMIVFEKTRQLARRVPFQRALAARGFRLLEVPEPIRYQLVEEVVDDGPFYVLWKGDDTSIRWEESPDSDEGAPFDRSALLRNPRDPDAPLYENHGPSAQHAWEALTSRKLVKEITREEADGRQMHVELGQAAEGLYLYCANTFDQRQLVVVEPARGAMIEGYYQEIVSGQG